MFRITLHVQPITTPAGAVSFEDRAWPEDTAARSLRALADRLDLMTVGESIVITRVPEKS